METTEGVDWEEFLNELSEEAQNDTLILEDNEQNECDKEANMTCKNNEISELVEMVKNYIELNKKLNPGRNIKQGEVIEYVKSNGANEELAKLLKDKLEEYSEKKKNQKFYALQQSILEGMMNKNDKNQNDVNALMNDQQYVPSSNGYMDNYQPDNKGTVQFVTSGVLLMILLFLLMSGIF